MLGVPPAFVLSQDQTLYKVCIYQSLLRNLIFLVHYDCSQLPVLVLKLDSFMNLNLQGFFFLSIVQFSRYFRSSFRAATFILYHLQKFLSSKHFVNWSPTCFLSVPSRRDQLFYFITFCRFCQVNILWTEVHSIFSFPFPRQPVQNSQPIHSTTLQAFCQVNFSWTTPTANCRSPDPFHSFPCPLFSQLSLSCDSFIIISHFFYRVK